MEIERVIVGELNENCYVISKDNECIIIDPGSEFEKIKELVHDRKVVGVLITHHHFDHVGALKEVIDYYYYYKSGFFNRYFTLLLSTCQLHSISYMFKNYIDKHRSSFDCFADKDIYSHSKRISMFLDDELITYDSSEFLNIIK